MPCYSSITDLAGLRFWAHPGIDLHFVTHPESMEEVEQIAGAGQRPVVEAADLARVPGCSLARRMHGARCRCPATAR